MTELPLKRVLVTGMMFVDKRVPQSIARKKARDKEFKILRVTGSLRTVGKLTMMGRS